MLVGQFLAVDEKTGEVYLNNYYNNRDVIERNRLEREHNPTGMSEEKLMMKIADIPVHDLMGDPDGVEFLNAPNGSKECEKALARFLVKFPQYRASYSKF